MSETKYNAIKVKNILTIPTLEETDTTTYPRLTLKRDGAKYDAGISNASDESSIDNDAVVVKFNNKVFYHKKESYSFVFPKDSSYYMYKTYGENSYSFNIGNNPDCSKVINAYGMFSSMKKMVSMPWNLNLINATNVERLFYSGAFSSSLEHKIDVSNSTSTKEMFSICSNLQSVSNLITSNKLTNTQEMFNNCAKLTHINTFDTTEVTNMNGMFRGCKSLVKKPNIDMKKVTDSSSMFNTCISLPTIELSMPNVIKVENMFYGCSSLTSVKLDIPKTKYAMALFYNCTKLIDIKQLNIPDVIVTTWMFNGCTSLASVPQLNTSKVTDMANMFNGCISLPKIFPWTIDCSSVTSANTKNTGINNIFSNSSVKEVHFKNVKASIASQFTAANLGSQLTNIVIENTI